MLLNENNDREVASSDVHAGWGAFSGTVDAIRGALLEPLEVYAAMWD